MVCPARQVLGDFDESDWHELWTFSDYGKIAFEPRRRVPLDHLLGDLRFTGAHACEFVAVRARMRASSKLWMIAPHDAVDHDHEREK